VSFLRQQLPCSPIPAASAFPVFVAPTVNRRGKTTNATVRYPTREIRLGPAQWAQDITSQAKLTIRNLLPDYAWNGVFIRARIVSIPTAATSNRVSGFSASLRANRKPRGLLVPLTPSLRALLLTSDSLKAQMLAKKTAT
jgi:hypothetical protein